MNDLSYIIPTRIESNDRLRNITTSVSYLLKKSIIIYYFRA